MYGKFQDFSEKIAELIEISNHYIEVNESNSWMQGLTIVQISDLHANNNSIILIEKMTELINNINPDIVVMTGDAICRGVDFIGNIRNCFSKIKAKYGKFACLGNHDHSDGSDSSKIQQAYRKSDFCTLLNESIKININGEKLYIAGADDIETGSQNIEKMRKKIPNDSTSIFLTHNPVNFKDFATHNPLLVLAGHTHGGQMYFKYLDFVYQIKLKCQYLSGFYEDNKSKLYVNRGIGTTSFTHSLFGKKISIHTPRINSKAEISVFNFIKSYPKEL